MVIAPSTMLVYLSVVLSPPKLLDQIQLFLLSVGVQSHINFWPWSGKKAIGSWRFVIAHCPLHNSSFLSFFIALYM